MFLGEYSHTVDSKGRLAVPVKFRKELAKGAVVTKGLDGCLFLFSATDWKKMAESLKSLPLTRADGRAFQRHMLSGAMEADVDKQGRVLLPEYLREFGKIKKEVVVTGAGDRVELWDAGVWKRYKAKVEKDSDHIAERMSELGI